MVLFSMGWDCNSLDCWVPGYWVRLSAYFVTGLGEGQVCLTVVGWDINKQMSPRVVSNGVSCGISLHICLPGVGCLEVLKCH